MHRRLVMKRASRSVAGERARRLSLREMYRLDAAYVAERP